MDSKHDLNSVMKSVRQFVKDYAHAKGYTLNPDLRERNKVIRGLAENQIKYDHRFCPSREVTENPVKDLMNICPCVWHKQEIEMQGHCKCKLFWKKEKEKNVLEKTALRKSSMEKKHKTKKGAERKNKYGLGEKGQTTFEYLLLVGGAVLLAVIVIHMMLSGLQSSAENVQDTFAGSISKMKSVAEDYLQKLENIAR